MIELLPQPEGPTRAANWPFSTVKLRPVKTGTSRLGYLKYTSLNAILAPPVSSWGVVDIRGVMLLGGDLRLRILFAEAVACAISTQRSDIYLLR